MNPEEAHKVISRLVKERRTLVEVEEALKAAVDAQAQQEGLYETVRTLESEVENLKVSISQLQQSKESLEAENRRLEKQVEASQLKAKETIESHQNWASQRIEAINADLKRREDEAIVAHQQAMESLSQEREAAAAHLQSLREEVESVKGKLKEMLGNG